MVVFTRLIMFRIQRIQVFFKLNTIYAVEITEGGLLKWMYFSYEEIGNDIYCTYERAKT